MDTPFANFPRPLKGHPEIERTWK